MAIEAAMEVLPSQDNRKLDIATEVAASHSIFDVETALGTDDQGGGQFFGSPRSESFLGSANSQLDSFEPYGNEGDVGNDFQEGGMAAMEKDPGEILDSIERSKAIADGDIGKDETAEEQLLSCRMQNENLMENINESSLVRMLCRQLESLAQREKEVEQTLSKERIERVVSQVEEEVEFEGVVEDMCLKFRAEGEYMDMERREMEWERERREVRLEEEVELLRNRVYCLEEQIRMANSEQQYALRSQEVPRLLGFRALHTDDGELMDLSAFIRGTSMESEGGLLSAFKQMLLAADEKAEKEHKALEDLEDIIHNEQQKWSDMEQQLENQIHALEKEVNDMREIIKEKESALSMEKEKRRQYGIEIDKVLAFWKEESSIHSRVCNKLNKFESFKGECTEKLMELRGALSPIEETKVDPLLSKLLRQLEDLDDEQHQTREPLKCLDWELTDMWKLQRDHLEDEREKLEEKLELASQQGREYEKILEAIWQRKERDLVQNIRDLETRLYDQERAWHAKVELLMNERRTVEIEVDVHRRECKVEKQRLQSMLLDREKWFEQQNVEGTALLQSREEELCTIKSAYQSVVDALLTSRKQLVDIRRELVNGRRWSSKRLRPVSIVDADHESCDRSADLCTCKSGKGTSGLKGGTEVDDGEVTEMGSLNVEQVTMDISNEIQRLSRVIDQEQKSVEKERMDMAIEAEQLKHERENLEKEVADLIILVEDLKNQIRTIEGQMEREKKQMDVALQDRTEEVETLKRWSNAQEVENERNAWKFKDELDVLNQEAERERKEKVERIDAQFAPRQNLIIDMEVKDASWEKEVETMAHEMEDLRRENDQKDSLILRLQKDVGLLELAARQNRLLRETMFACSSQGNKGTTQIGHNVQPVDCSEDITLEGYKRCGVELASLWSDGFPDSKIVEWQDVIGKVAGFDKQIEEAMVAIQSLKEELNMKEKELQRARMERELDQCKEILDQDSLFEVQTEFNTDPREKEELIKLLEAEKADTADAMSTLQGAVRELQWALKHSKGKDVEDVSFEAGTGAYETQIIPIKDDLVKVHVSHLEELDRVICELKMKTEEAERRSRAAEVALAVYVVKENAKNTGTTSSALVTAGRERFDKDQISMMSVNELLPSDVRRDCVEGSSFEVQDYPRFLNRKPTKGGQGSRNFGHNFADNAGLIFSASRHEQRWNGEASEQNRLIDLAVSSSGADGTSCSSLSSNWMTVRGATDDNSIMYDPFQQGALTLAVSIPLPRSKRRWLVDASWIENVRKEQSFLRQQLELEQQRVSALKQVELENKWMEDTIISVLEQKRESDARALELERKVEFLEALMGRKAAVERSPLSRPFYKGPKS